MKKGNGIFATVLVLWFLAEMGGHSAEPFVLVASNAFLLVMAVFSAWKVVEFIGDSINKQ